jgi:hypothetical protein
MCDIARNYGLSNKKLSSLLYVIQSSRGKPGKNANFLQEFLMKNLKKLRAPKPERLALLHKPKVRDTLVSLQDHHIARKLYQLSNSDTSEKSLEIYDELVPGGDLDLLLAGINQELTYNKLKGKSYATNINKSFSYTTNTIPNKSIETKVVKKPDSTTIDNQVIKTNGNTSQVVKGNVDRLTFSEKCDAKGIDLTKEEWAKYIAQRKKFPPKNTVVQSGKTKANTKIIPKNDLIDVNTKCLQSIQQGAAGSGYKWDEKDKTNTSYKRKKVYKEIPKSERSIIQEFADTYVNEYSYQTTKSLGQFNYDHKLKQFNYIGNNPNDGYISIKYIDRNTMLYKKEVFYPDAEHPDLFISSEIDHTRSFQFEFEVN